MLFRTSPKPPCVGSGGGGGGGGAEVTGGGGGGGGAGASLPNIGEERDGGEGGAPTYQHTCQYFKGLNIFSFFLKRFFFCHYLPVAFLLLEEEALEVPRHHYLKSL